MNRRRQSKTNSQSSAGSKNVKKAEPAKKLLFPLSQETSQLPENKEYSGEITECSLYTTSVGKRVRLKIKVDGLKKIFSTSFPAQDGFPFFEAMKVFEDYQKIFCDEVVGETVAFTTKINTKNGTTYCNIKEFEFLESAEDTEDAEDSNTDEDTESDYDEEREKREMDAFFREDDDE